RASRGTAIAAIAWIACAVLHLKLAGMPIASERTADAIREQSDRVVGTLRDEAAFAREARSDTFGGTPPDQLVPELRGKDVLITFIESYGRSAIEDPVIAPTVTPALDAGTESLAEAGYQAR